MVAVGAEVFGIKTIMKMHLRKRTADLTFKLAAFFAVVKVKILSWCRASSTDGIFRNFGLRIFNIDGF